MLLSELFQDSDLETATKRLKKAIKGDRVKLGGTYYVKTGDTEVDPYVAPIREAVAEDFSSGGDKLTGEDEIWWANQLAAEFGKRFRMVRTEFKSRFVLHEFDPFSREMALTDTEHVKARMRNACGGRLTLRQAEAVTRRAFDILQCSKEYVVSEATIAPLLFEDQEPERFCYRRLPITQAPLTEAPQPFVDLLKLAASDDGQFALTLWLGSLLDPDSSRIQYITLYGGGNNGKSTLVDALHQVLGVASLKMSSGDFMSRFGLSDAANKRAMLFDDNNNTSFMSTGEFKRVTGSNTLKVERKGENSFETRNHLKILIATNRLLQVTGDEADIRRNIIVNMRPYVGDKTKGDQWVQSFNAAMPDILRYCYTEYRKHRESSGSSMLPVPADAQEGLRGFSARADAEDFINAHFYGEQDAEAVKTPMEQRRVVRPLDVKKLLTRDRVDAKVATLVKELMHNTYPPFRHSPYEPRLHRGVWLRPSIVLLLTE